jgi:hypothetical protein
MPAMRALYAVSLFALSACGAATAPASSGTSEQPAQVMNTGDGFTVSTTAESRLLKHDVNAPVDRVWEVLPDVYREIGLQGAADAGIRTVSSGSLSFARRMFGEPATRFFDCGRGQFGAEIAATYTIHLTVRTTVQPGDDAGTSRLESTAQAYARNNDGANSLMSQCHSKGLLEGLIALRVLERLGTTGSAGR